MPTLPNDCKIMIQDLFTRIESKWIGKRIEYQKNVFATVLDEDKTHILIQFDNGIKIATTKTRYSNQI